MNIKRFVFAPITVLVGLAACNGSDDLSHKEIETEIKKNHVAIAYAMYSDSLATAEDLETAVATFLQTPTEQNLDLAKTAYKATRVPYQQSEILRWDTDITLGTNTADAGIASVDDWEGQVNAWPLAEGFIDYVDVNDDGVVDGSDTQAANIISENSAANIDKQLLIDSNGEGGNEANVATGVHAIEFLLWGQDLNGIGAGAGTRPATDYDLSNCSNNYCESRRKYLEVATELLVDDLEAMKAEWSPSASKTKGTLANNFLNHPEALSYIVAAMKAMATDELASARMGSAFELLDTEEEHDCFSDLSHLAIYYNYQGVRNAFYGKYKGIDGWGVGDLLELKDPSTYALLDSAFDSIQVDMKAIYDLGESQTQTIRFDQLVGQKVDAENASADADPVGEEYLYVDEASIALIELSATFDDMSEILSLSIIGTDGGSDGD